ncbi:ABC transporter ATP-binding protein [Nocardioides carbamazepini]|uniref:ABC transporter ATP-binding protein n=1 Tax=Nocardioides carbamazepini TaxID=2854259 RepID=UPI002149E728|nr:ABC transporter ATP-binding protein [Nocardioides carbamazepini]MCR1784925.1 ABC transporter ATP-binding protein [Nocardioides carbamazepini]
MSESQAGLHAHGITVRYGGVTAVEHVSISVLPGQIVGLIGPNGAGKTSFVDAITGFAQAEGSVVLDGRDLTGLKPHQRRSAGLARTWQAGELFSTMTIEENVLTSAAPPGAATLFRDIFLRRPDRRATVDGHLDVVGLSGRAEVSAGSLTLGQQKLVGVARALAGGASILLLDEPAAGLDSNESLEFADRMRRITDHGAGILIIDHDVDLMIKACDLIYVLEFGKLIFQGTPSEMRSDQRVIAAYLGSPIEGGAA